MRGLRRVILILPLMLALIACEPAGGSESYAMTPVEMRDRLESSVLPVEQIGSGGYGLGYRTTRLGDGSLVWKITSNKGTGLVIIKVRILAVDDGSRFDIEVTGASNKAEQGLRESPSFRSHFLEFAREHCDSVLNGRPFNALAVHSRTLRPNAEENARTARDMQAAGGARRQREAANFKRAYREEVGRNPWE